MSAGFRRLVTAAAFLLAVGCAPAANDEPQSDTAAEPQRLVYVASQSGAAVSVVDATVGEVVATVDLVELGFTENAKPHHVVIEPDGSHWYVSLIADGRVLKFDRDNNLVGQAEFETPGMMSLDPVSDLLYVGRSMAAVSPPTRIGVVDRTTMAIEEVDVFFQRPHALLASPVGGLVYTASLAENRLAAVLPAEEDLELVDVPGDTHTFVQFAISPDGSTLVTGGQISGEILVWSLDDPYAPELAGRHPLGGQPWHPVFAPDSRVVYFPQRTADSVAVVDTADWSVTATISGGGLFEPHGSAISPDGRWLYVSGRNTAGSWGETPEGGLPPGTLNVIDTTTYEVVRVVEVPAYAAGIATASGIHTTR